MSINLKTNYKSMQLFDNKRPVSVNLIRQQKRIEDDNYIAQYCAKIGMGQKVPRLSSCAM